MLRMESAAFCLLAVLSNIARTETGTDGVYNVALHKNIVLANVSENQFSLAVDGNVDQDLTSGSCIRFETEGDIWWQVDFGDIYTILDIRVITREDTLKATEEDCFNTLSSYAGTTNTTISGKTCQRWDQQYPHRHYHDPNEHWKENYLLENYCRAPNNWDILPWCYTTDPDTDWDDCDIRQCEYDFLPNINLKTGTRKGDLVNTTFLGVVDGTHSTLEVILATSLSARYVEFRQSGRGFYHICEVEVYGTKAFTRPVNGGSASFYGGELKKRAKGVSVVTLMTETIRQMLTKTEAAMANVALHKTAEMSSVHGDQFGPNLAVDGILNQNILAGSCFHSAHEYSSYYDHEFWWHVYLGQIYSIVMVRIYNRLDCCSDRAHNLELSFRKQSLWFRYSLGSQINDVHNFYVNIEAEYLQVSMHGEGPFHLCEVQVFAKIEACQYNPCKNGGNCSVQYCGNLTNCRNYTCSCPSGYGGADCETCVENVAIGKEIIASSINHSSWLTSNAIDGDTNQYVVNGATCVSTQKETNPYLIIDLGTEYTLSSVKVYKRLDCCYNVNFELLLMKKTWTSFGSTNDSTENVVTFNINPNVPTRLVRIETTETQPTSLQLCEVEVLRICQEEMITDTDTLDNQPKPFMQMRFSVSDEYNDVVKSEDSFAYSIRQELSNVTGYSVESFQNVQVEKDPFRVMFELHSTDGNLLTLSEISEKVEKLFKQGITDMETEDGQKITIVAGSLQYHVNYSKKSESAGTQLDASLLMAVSILVIIKL